MKLQLVYILKKHDKLKAKFNEYGGYDTINKAKELMLKNIDGYINYISGSLY